MEEKHIGLAYLDDALDLTKNCTRYSIKDLNQFVIAKLLKYESLFLEYEKLCNIFLGDTA